MLVQDSDLYDVDEVCEVLFQDCWRVCRITDGHQAPTFRLEVFPAREQKGSNLFKTHPSAITYAHAKNLRKLHVTRTLLTISGKRISY